MTEFENEISHAVLQLTQDGTYILANLYSINKVSFEWLSNDPSNWPKEEVEVKVKQTDLHGHIKFVVKSAFVTYIGSKCIYLYNIFI